MASGHYKHEAELSVTDIEEGENEQITYAIHDILVKEEAPEIKPLSKYWNEQNASGNQFDALHILKEEIVEKDPTETKPFSEYGVLTVCLKKNEDIFYDPDSSAFEVMQRYGKDPKESTFSPTHSCENTECNSLTGDLAKPEVNHNSGVMLKNEDGDHCKCTEDSSTNNVEPKTEILETEYDINIIHDDVDFKSNLCDEKSIGKNENESFLNFDTDISIGTNFSHELSTGSETWSQHNIEEDGTAVKKANDTGKLPHCEYYPFESKKGHLTQHKTTHTREKPFQCIVCPENFEHKSELLDHNIIHTGKRPFQCKICSIFFSVKKNLIRHEIIHTGEKPFQCKICSKSFNQKGDLKRHERTHTGEKPFQCKICTKSFSQRGHLTRHEIIHNGKEPFHC